MINMPQNGPDFQVEDEKNTAKVIPLNSHSTGVAPTDEDLANAVKVAEQQITVSSAIDHSIWGLRRSLSRPVAKATTEEPKPWWEEVEETEGDEQPAQRQQPQTQPYAPQRAPTQSKPAVNQSGKYDDFAQKMIALSAERKREEVNDGWKQYESVPPVGIQDDIKKSDSGIAVREGKEFRQRDDLVIESREITQPEATERHETHEAEQSQSQQVDTRKNSEKWRHSYGKTDAAVVALMDAEVHGALFETVVMIAKFSRKLSNGDWVFNLSGEQFGKRLGCNQKAAAKRINDAVKAGFIEKIGNHCAGRTGATYRLKF